MSKLLANLNAEQFAAVTLPNESALIIAGAGSGKTHVFTTRIAYLITEKQVNPGSIMAVTFTNKAAREMLSRLEGMLPEHVNIKSMWIGTFHSICNRLLRIHASEAGLPGLFQIIDTSEQLSLIKKLIKTINDQNNNEDGLPKKLQSYINSSKEKGLRAHQIPSSDEYTNSLTELYDLYEKACYQQGLVDFNELLLRCFEMLNKNSTVNQSLTLYYKQRFTYLFVDEFQDTSRLQYAWLKSFVSSSNSIFAVGDDDQTIYSFRGSNVGNMFDFKREFEVKHVIKLEKNYRSHAHILNAANCLIAHNSNRFGKNLGTDHASGEPLFVFEALDDREEASWIADEIFQLITRGNIYLKDIAILYRSNAQLRILEQVFTSKRIMYCVSGGKHFFESLEIKDLLAYLRLLSNPDDDLAFLRVVNRPAREIGPLRLQKLAECSKHHDCSMSAAVVYLTGKTRSIFDRFIELLTKWRSETESLNLKETMSYLISETGLALFYQKEPNGQARIEKLNELMQDAMFFYSELGLDSNIPARQILQTSTLENAYLSNILASGDSLANDILKTNNEKRTILSEFLAYASLGANDEKDKMSEDAVKLMTIHASKGLEFHAVFITGLEEGLFPYNHSDDEGFSEEERRLMYVAITRARERLYLSFAHNRMLHGKVRYHTKSRFLNELPANSLKWIVSHSVKLLEQKDRAGQSYTWGNRSLEKMGSINMLRRSEDLFHGMHFSVKKDKKNMGALESSSSYRLGQMVRHAKFGEGTIIQFEGEGKNKRARVHFYNSGNKWLLLELARLENCDHV